MKIFFGIIFLCVFIIICPASNSSKIPFQKNTVKIRASYTDSRQDSAFGFIYCEVEDSLIIVTVKSLLEPELRELKIEYFDKRVGSPGKAIILYKHNFQDYAVLKLRKPSWFSWQQDIKGSTVPIEGEVFILGRYGDLKEYSPRNRARVLKADFHEIQLESSSKEFGLKGCPVIFQDNIAGITTSDFGNRLTAIAITPIQLNVNKVIDIDVDKYTLGYPFFLVGGKSKLVYPISNQEGIVYTSIVSALENGFFVELGLISPFSIRFEKNLKYHVSSKRLKVQDTYYQGRTEFESYSIILQYRERKLLSSSPNSFSNIFVGITRMKQKPMVRMNNEPWVDLENFNGANYTYTEKFNSYVIGGNYNHILRNLFLLRADIGFWYTTSNYILPNPLKLDQKYSIGWQIFVQLNLGFYLYKGKTFRNYIR